jgi:hypothetical protein
MVGVLYYLIIANQFAEFLQVGCNTFDLVTLLVELPMMLTVKYVLGCSSHRPWDQSIKGAAFRHVNHIAPHRPGVRQANYNVSAAYPGHLRERL